MKRIFTLLVATAGLISGLSGIAAAQQSSATTSANANATIIAAIAITKVADMEFGAVVSGGTSGTVVLTASASPTRTATGGTTLGNSTSVASAAFTVSG